MSRASYIVISNSTFSWWGAYLGNKIVISPILSIWETNLKTPDSWIQVNDGNLYPITWHGDNIFNAPRFHLTSKVRFISRLIRKIISNSLIFKKIYFFLLRNQLRIFTRHSSKLRILINRSTLS